MSKDFNSRPSARGDKADVQGCLRHCVFQFTPLREGRPPPRALPPRPLPISIHAPPRGATGYSDRGANVQGFQFTPLREGRPFRRRPGRGTASHFNSRPSARGDRSSLPNSLDRIIFQFTPLREGRPLDRIMTIGVSEFQFTPLREGRREGSHRGAVEALPISIHAPPRGATRRPPAFFRHEHISIHAPPRGATRSPGERRCTALFQFTPLREGRRKTSGARKRYCISIHAPPRGATANVRRRGRAALHFNSRPSARGDACRRITTTK